MKNKVIIDNVLKRVKGLPEEELPVDTTIRFVLGDCELSCSIVDNELRIYKLGGGFSEVIQIIPSSSNVIKIK